MYVFEVDGKLNHPMKWNELLYLLKMKSDESKLRCEIGILTFPLKNDTIGTLGHIVVFMMVLKSLNN